MKILNFFLLLIFLNSVFSFRISSVTVNHHESFTDLFCLIKCFDNMVGICEQCILLVIKHG